MQKHVPLRKCMGCGEIREKQELFRLIRISINENSSLVLDDDMKAQCRGAYICKNAGCISKAQKSKRLNRSLGCGMTDDFCNSLLKLI